MRLPTILPVLSDFWDNPRLVSGMTETDCLEKDGLGHPFLCPWMDGIAQRARKAVRLCPWMDGLKIAPAFSALPTSMWVVSAKSQEGGAVLFSNLATEKCHLKKAYYCHAGFVYA